MHDFSSQDVKQITVTQCYGRLFRYVNILCVILKYFPLNKIMQTALKFTCYRLT